MQLLCKIHTAGFTVVQVRTLTGATWSCSTCRTIDSAGQCTQANQTIPSHAGVVRMVSKIEGTGRDQAVYRRTRLSTSDNCMVVRENRNQKQSESEFRANMCEGSMSPLTTPHKKHFYRKQNLGMLLPDSQKRYTNAGVSRQTGPEVGTMVWTSSLRLLSVIITLLQAHGLPQRPVPIVEIGQVW